MTVAQWITIGISAVSLFLTIITIWIGLRKSSKEAAATQAKLAAEAAAAQARTDAKLEELTREVREHNNFARRMPVAENNIKTLYKRVEKLEAMQ